MDEIFLTDTYVTFNFSLHLTLTGIFEMKSERSNGSCRGRYNFLYF